MREESNSMTHRPPELEAVVLGTTMPRRRRAEQLPAEAGELHEPVYFRVSPGEHQNAAHGKVT